MSAGGLTDAEREALREVGGAGVWDDVFAVVERIKADAYRQGRADLAAKVEALADEWERGLDVDEAHYMDPTRRLVRDLRAILATDGGAS